MISIRSVAATVLMLLVCCLAVSAAEPPGVVREDIEWLDVWMPHSNETDQPRVLLIGDSITRAYGPEVEKLLAGQAYVARLATSKSLGDPALLAQVRLILSEARFDVIHFNNGMHGWGYTEGQYARQLPELVRTLRKGAPSAKLILATTTPVRAADKLEEISPRTDRVRARNRIAAAVAAREKIPVDDLFALVENRPEYFSRDGVHASPVGVQAEAAQVAEHIRGVLR